MKCQFREQHGRLVCVACGFIVPQAATYAKRIIRRCPNRQSGEAPPCPHLGAPFTNESDTGNAEVMVPCGCGGNANKERPATVFECLLFRDADGDPGECLPYWRPSDKQREKYKGRLDAIRLCDGCGRGLL